MTDDPGIWFDLSFEDYLALPGLSRSRLFVLYSETPSRFKWQTDHPEEIETQAMRDGTAIHAALLEPDLFATAYAVGGPVNPATGACYGQDTKTYRQWADQQGKPCLRTEEYDTFLALSKVVHDHPRLGPMLSRMKTEVSLQWRNGETGLLLKARLDAVHMESGMLLDLKSTRSASAQRFGHDAYTNGYLFQAGMYVEGFRAVSGREVQRFILAAVEKEPPFDLQCFALAPEQLELGKAQMTDALRQLVLCQQYNDWPGYPTGLEDLILPGWAGQEWTPFAEGLETTLRVRATKAGRPLPPQRDPADDDDNILGL